jgi:phosphoglycolate phosphatase-like HAD superfamily hydrolase
MSHRKMLRYSLLIECVLAIALLHAEDARSADALPSWNESATKNAIVTFVDRVRTQGVDFVDPAKRIAVFDNDGTLWPEQPVYFQFAYAIDTIKVLAPQHPQWHNTSPFNVVLAKDQQALAALGEKDILELLTASHAGMTTDQFAGSVRSWMRYARHPRYDRKYSQLVYQPMLELLAYLRANGFKTYIVSGGGVDFIRVISEELYGVPPEQVIGSSGATKFELNERGTPVLVKQTQIEFVNDGAGKPSGIHRFIGRRPIFAFGNSDGDLEMLQWTAAGETASFVGLVHHTDAKREYAYDRESRIGQLDRALKEAERRQWTVVDMKAEWRIVFPPSQDPKR